MKRCAVIIKNGIKNLHPANFAMVMATGIISIAFEIIAFPIIAKALLALNLILYFSLCVTLIARALFFLPNLITDFRNLRHAFLFLTFVVGTNTIGMQLIIFYQATELAIILWFIALTGWLTCIYFIFLDFISLQEKSTPSETVNGTTLLIVVSIVSLVLLGIHLLDATGIDANYAFYFLLGLWILSFILYLIIAVLLLKLLFFRRFELDNWNAPYWICMGAAAIITLAGSEFTIRMPISPAWESIQITVLWMTVFAWGIGTLWIPYLLLMDTRQFTHMDIETSAPVWIKIFPWSRLAFGNQYHAYEPSSWSRVFPMGMYMASTLFLVKTTNLDSLAIIPQYWGWFALLTWTLTFIGMLRVTTASIGRF